MINRVAIAAAIGAAIGMLAANPLVGALDGLLERPAIAVVFGLPLAVGATFAGLGALFVPGRSRIAVRLKAEPPAR